MLQDCPTLSNADHVAQADACLQAGLTRAINAEAAYIVGVLVHEGCFDIDPKDDQSVDNFAVAVRLVAAILNGRRESFGDHVGVPFAW